MDENRYKFLFLVPVVRSYFENEVSGVLELLFEVWYEFCRFTSSIKASIMAMKK